MDIRITHIQIYWTILLIIVQIMAESVTYSANNSTNIFHFVDKIPHFQRAPHAVEILLIDFHVFRQTHISTVLQNFSQLRRIHSQQPPLAFSTINFANMIAQTINASLVSVTDLVDRTHVQQDITEIIRTHPRLRFLFINELEILYREKVVKNVSTAYPIQAHYTNFVYCAKTCRIRRGEFSFFSALFAPVDTFTWILILISIASITFVIRKDNINSSSHTYVVLALISAFISFGVSGNIRSKSLTFQAWTFTCLVFTTYYAGDLTSFVISPLPEKKIGTFEELLGNNWSLVFGSQGSLRFARKSVFSSIDRGTDNFVARMEAVFNTANVVSSNDKVYEKLVHAGQRLAFIHLWFITVNTANKGNNLIKKNTFKNQKCYIGNELRFKNVPHFVFTGLHRMQMSTTYRQLVETGFYRIWQKEFVGVATSSRVQSRTILIHPTQIKEDVSPPIPLEMDGTLTDIVCLWMFGLGGSVIAFVVEIRVRCSNRVTSLITNPKV